MAKYRKKPIVIEAAQWFPGAGLGVSEEAAPVGHGRRCTSCSAPLDAHGRVPTLEGEHIVCPGDWIITGVKGERYPCKPEIFAATYERVDEDPDA